jgi:FtsP/CotA-like multicopper oxidase with cupredoxin domain
MRRYPLVPAFAALALTLAACGGGEDAPPVGDEAQPVATPAPAASAMPAPPTGPMTMPDWYAIDRDARTVSMTITAGATPDANYWNYNGFIKGALAITVPQGYTVTIDLVNRDPNMAHSLGIQRDFTNPMMPAAPNPAFAGAVTENPQSMTDGTMPGQTQTITFVADAAGDYHMICYVPGHTAVGMWLYFNVSASDEAGVQGL